MIKVGSDFSGIGSFNQALMRLKIEYKEVFACDMDKYARQTFIHNYGEPEYFPENVYDRKIPEKSLDIYMTSPPCQAFSLAGKRKGEDDKRGILFYNSHEFIAKNKPRYFIFENVKGLLSDDGGKTFKRWIDMLGGKSVNGNPVIFPREDATPYHIYYKVLNAKHYGVPQNRERVFIVGIRDDEDNTFYWPKKQYLSKRLKDVLEFDVDKKYYLSDKYLTHLFNHKERHDKKGTGFGVKLKDDNSIASTLRANGSFAPTDNHIKVKSNTLKGYEIAKEGDSIDLSHLNSKTRRGRVGKGVAQTLDTTCNQAIMIGAIRGRNPEFPSSREVGLPTVQRLEINVNGTSNTLTTVQKDNVVVYGNLKGGKWDKIHEQSCRVYDPEGVGATIHTMSGGNQHPKIIEKWIKGGLQSNQVSRKDGKSPCLTSAMGMGGGHTPIHNYENYKIRRLTPRECFRLMDFPDTFTWTVSDSQAYKQAGNSIVVNVLAEIIKRLNF